MKKVFKITCIASACGILATIFAFTYPKQIEVFATKASAYKQGEAVAFTFYRPSRQLKATGAITAWGKWSMDVTTTGKAFHCINTMVFPDGTIIAKSNCNTVTMKGVWQIISGTGAYEGIDGNGSLVMLAYGEEWEGTIK